MLIMQKIALSLALGLSLFTGVAHAQTCLPKKVQDLPKLADAREINCVTNEKGKSLGLAIVKHIVAQHEAQISLESEEGAGTEIKVTFLK